MLEGGDPHGVPVFHLHGTPGCRSQYPPFSSRAAAEGIRCISFDRPGYGGSTPAPGRRVVDVARDVALIADDLGLDRFGVLGFSGGGAPALACAAVLPERVVASVSMAGMAPYPSDGLDWFAGMAPSQAADYHLLLRDPAAWEQELRASRERSLSWTMEQFRTAYAAPLSEEDRSALTEEWIAYRFACVPETWASGHEGARDDALAQVKPWGCDLGRIEVPVQIWHGGRDRLVPFGHGQWIAAHSPGAEAHLEPEEGHLSIILRRALRAQRWLAERF